MNGAFLTGRTVPDEPWVSRGWLRSFVSIYATAAVARLPELRDEPLVRLAFPGDRAERVQRPWAERESLLAALERLPQTFCHLDAFRRDLFLRRRSTGGWQTVAVDWAFAGRAAVGQELAALVAASPLFAEFAASGIGELDGVCFEGYLAGLRDAGWHGDARLVRAGCRIGAAVRYGSFGLRMLLLDASARESAALSVGGTPEGVCAAAGQVGTFLLDRLDEARELIPRSD
jgi:hypothetical protein